jgi:hypothetical protein
LTGDASRLAPGTVYLTIAIRSDPDL